MYLKGVGSHDAIRDDHGDEDEVRADAGEHLPDAVPESAALARLVLLDHRYVVPHFANFPTQITFCTSHTHEHRLKRNFQRRKPIWPLETHCRRRRPMAIIMRLAVYLFSAGSRHQTPQRRTMRLPSEAPPSHSLLRLFLSAACPSAAPSKCVTRPTLCVGFFTLAASIMSTLAIICSFIYTPFNPEQILIVLKNNAKLQSA